MRPILDPLILVSDTFRLQQNSISSPGETILVEFGENIHSHDRQGIHVKVNVVAKERIEWQWN